MVHRNHLVRALLAGSMLAPASVFAADVTPERLANPRAAELADEPPHL